VILFGDNIASRAQVSAVCRQLQAAAASSPQTAPLLIMTDQEGGEIRRLPGAPTLSEQQIGASPEGSTLATEAGTNAALNLRAYGLNVNLAPDADVARSPSGFIGSYHRSYGANAAHDGTLAAAFIAAQQRAGVAATAKHFPGLGTASADQDTDAGPVTLPVSLTTLRAVDELPFRAAIGAGVKLVMISWAVYPALDRTLPAGLSARVIQGELRGRLGFAGVTITDALGAGALRAYGNLGRRAVLAAGAGADLLLSTTPGTTPVRLSGTSVVGAVAAAITSGRLSRNAAEQAVARVLVLRRSLQR
jgi:beta-N-acetylhexosaminidase